MDFIRARNAVKRIFIRPSAIFQESYDLWVSFGQPKVRSASHSYGGDKIPMNFLSIGQKMGDTGAISGVWAGGEEDRIYFGIFRSFRREAEEGGSPV